MGHHDLVDEIMDWHDELRRTRSGIDIIRAIEEKINKEADSVTRWHLNDVLAEEHAAQGNPAAARHSHPHMGNSVCNGARIHRRDRAWHRDCRGPVVVGETL